MNELLFHSMTEMKFKSIVLSQEVRHKDCILHDIIYGKFKNVQHYGDTKSQLLLGRENESQGREGGTRKF